MKFILRYGLMVLSLVLFFVGSEVNNSSVSALGILLFLPSALIASRSSLIGCGKDMQLLNGIGTTLYGKSNFDQTDGTHISTKFFVFFFIPIFPIASYRIKKKETTKKFMGSCTHYEMNQVSLNKAQAIGMCIPFLTIISAMIILVF